MGMEELNGFLLIKWLTIFEVNFWAYFSKMYSEGVIRKLRKRKRGQKNYLSILDIGPDDKKNNAAMRYGGGGLLSKLRNTKKKWFNFEFNLNNIQTIKIYYVTP